MAPFCRHCGSLNVGEEPKGPDTIDSRFLRLELRMTRQEERMENLALANANHRKAIKESSELTLREYLSFNQRLMAVESIIKTLREMVKGLFA